MIKQHLIQIYRCIHELLVKRGVNAVRVMKYYAHFSSPTIRTLHGDLTKKGFSQAINFKCLVFCTENDLRMELMKETAYYRMHKMDSWHAQPMPANLFAHQNFYICRCYYSFLESEVGSFFFFFHVKLFT